jgi:hypothetical protein
MENYQVMSMMHLQMAKFLQGMTFVLAANALYYPSVRAVISSILSVIESYERIILYDLGGIVGNTSIVSIANNEEL